ncbi:MAG: hypothetical protein AB1538_04020 [Bacillota bacterium]
MKEESLIRTAQISSVLERLVTSGVNYFHSRYLTEGDASERDQLAKQLFQDLLSDIAYLAENNLTRSCVKKIAILQLLLEMLLGQDEAERKAQQQAIKRIAHTLRNTNKEQIDFVQNLLQVAVQDKILLKKYLNVGQ